MGRIRLKMQIIATIVPPSSVQVKATADVKRQVARGSDVFADTRRSGIKTEKVSADTKRQIESASVAWTNADLLRKLAMPEKGSADTARLVSCQYAKANADTSRILSMNFCVRRSKCLRQISKRERGAADTTIRQGIDGLSMADTLRKLGWGEPAVSHTRRQVIKFQSLFADTSIRVPVVLAYVDPAVRPSPARKLRAAALPSIMDNFREHGIRSFSMSLGELTLSDNFQLETVQPLNIDDSVQGQIFDYKFHFLVEETSQRDLVQTVKGMYSKDKLLYSAISFFVNEVEVSYYANGIAKALGLKLDMSCDDFIPSQNFEDSGMTYQDFISSLFGWTSKLPQRQINVFIRGDTLHIIQRGREHSVVDITDWPHSRPTIERKLVRSIWHSTMENAGKAHNDEDNEPKGFTGTISLGEISRSYSNGFLTHETNEKGYTDYVYDGEYLSEKNTHNKDGSTSRTEYFYAKTNRDIYLFEEKERTTEPIDDGQEHDIYDWTDWNNQNGTERITYHAPLGYGWYSTVVYVDGELEGSSLSQGKPGGKASRFTIDQSNLSLGADYDMGDDDDGPKYESLIDTEFPVIGEDYLWELTKAIEWLNRKTQETVTVEVVANVRNGVPDVKHIVDFTERIKFNGNEYFLVSNVVELTPRSLRQTIKMMRWY
ncbi:hypothetical protein SAMN02910323_0558 [Selenomonas ruminantium]|uniref:Uncharacterized protein n=2 Tax=Selenomonas ruminantium TaxID=971 RepID=A0A1K1M776_SELRU|nr:hypothetical protein SAMN02910323_0558 [Selenomonas ruminantium]